MRDVRSSQLGVHRQTVTAELLRKALLCLEIEKRRPTQE